MALTENGFYYRVDKEKVMEGDLQKVVIQKFQNEAHRNDYVIFLEERYLPSAEKTIDGEFLSSPVCKFINGPGLIAHIINVYAKDTTKTDEANTLSAVYSYAKTFEPYSTMEDLI